MKPRKIQEVLYEKVKDRMVLKGLMQKKQKIDEYHSKRASIDQPPI